MENAEEVMQFLEDFSKRKPKTIPQELNDYLAYVARTGDPVYQWSLVKSLFKEKLLNVITDFYETTPSIEIPPYPNVDPFNYDLMKNSLLERLDTFTAAPFTVQRICELLTYPRKQYNRVDKFMRAVEKNILVVSTREPGTQRHVEPENGEPMEPIVNGSDNNSEYNVDVEMEDMSWKENNQQKKPSEPQPSSSDTQITVDDIEARLQTKETTPMETQDKANAEYESVTPPEINVTSDEETPKPSEDAVVNTAIPDAEASKSKPETKMETLNEAKTDIEMKSEESLKDPLEIPEIKVDDADMTEQRLLAEANAASETPTTTVSDKTEPTEPVEEKPVVEVQQTVIDESSSDSNVKEENEIKTAPEISTSSEESCSSSDNTDCNSNSPKTDSEPNTDVQEESSQSDSNPETVKQPEEVKEAEDKEIKVEPIKETPQIQPDNYSITDVHSELPQPPAEPVKAEETPKETEVKKVEKSDEKEDDIVKTAELETVPETKDA